MPLKRRPGLRIPAAARIVAYHVPDGFLEKFLPRRRLVTDSGRVDAVFYFVRFHRALAAALPGLGQRVRPNGCVWVFWPTGGTRNSDLDAEAVRHLAHVLGWHESQAAKFFGTWTGMKLTPPRVD